jgi:cAMP-binding proteins - catabolite gene activator and regulatory subunit of cAMP-dependent protein kinases
MYCIFTGKVGIYKSKDLDEDGRKKPGSPMHFVAELKPYEIIGELSVLHGTPRTATAIALEETEVIVLEKAVYDNVMKVKLA